ncbi:hypothetical protein GCM10007424_19870 [Flavobacterium suaedae]|uniref:Uncharacterized protein n=1 Tax=Flavobacterium suaedae TaxID=1767027 RepID=A0ABQ1K004_9FLAO|nr:hypothetical protein [Flavobacterium suaedae]GGB79723.1 hypothetical protein GCM10007424_19870 [Flavobacterium suaedae]
MKKFFLLLTVTVLSLSITSCSGDDDSGSTASGSYVKFKVDGVQKNFTNISIEEPNDYSAIIITAQNGNNISEIVEIEINVNEDDNSLEELYFSYYEGDAVYYFAGANTSFNYETELYTMDRVKGVFTGVLGNYNGEEMQYRTFTEGSFDIDVDALLQ